MNGMCVLPVTGRNTVGGVGGERGDNGDNSDGCSTGVGGGGGGGGGSGGGGGGGGGGSNGAYNNDGGGGGSSGAGACIIRSGTRNAAAGAISGTDEEINMQVSRKGVTLDQRHPRAQGIRKLQKCLSTTTSHFEVDSASSAAAAFPTVSLFYAQRSTEMRSCSSAAPQASLNYQNILTNTRQYSSFGSIVSTATYNFNYLCIWTTVDHRYNYSLSLCDTEWKSYSSLIA